MIYIATNKDNRDALMHYGVKGMRWGKRGGGINRYRRLAPGTPGLSAPTKVLNTYGIHRGNAVTKARPDKEHNTYGIHKGAAVTRSTVDRPRDYTPKPPIPQRNTSRNSLTRGGAGNPFDPRRTSTRREEYGHTGAVQYRRISDSERQNMIDRRNRAVSQVQSNQNRKERPKDLRRRRYGR